jgi:hypothetical protein
VEDHDFRVIEARKALAGARKRDPGELTASELREEITRFRKYVRWLIDLADDAADTEYDEEVSQVMIYGGVELMSARAAAVTRRPSRSRWRRRCGGGLR